MQCGAVPLQLNFIQQDSWTPLIASSDLDRKDTVKLLIEKKAQLDIQTKVNHCHPRGHQFNIMSFLQEGWTALSLASWRGHTKTVEILVQAGADVNIQGQVKSKLIVLMKYTNYYYSSMLGGADCSDAGHPERPC